MLSEWYPPARYVFMPMYRSYRRLFGTKRSAFVALLASSGVFHLLLVTVFGWIFHQNVVIAQVFISVAFTALTIASALLGNHRRAH